MNFLTGADAKILILQCRTWEKHAVGATPGFNGDVEKALHSIKTPFLYMPSETDLYFPIGDARYEAAFMSTVTLTPIPSLWGHTAGAGPNPEDLKFLMRRLAGFWEDRRWISRRRKALTTDEHGYTDQGASGQLAQIQTA